MTGGRLVVVATPIGNLGDLSPRAAATLAEADVVVCEDTRRTGRLLEHAGIAKKRLHRGQRALARRRARPRCAASWTPARPSRS